MRRIWLLVPILAAAVGFLVGVHAYVARRLILEPGLPEPWRTTLLAAVVALGASLVLAPFGERLLRPSRARWIAWPAAVWMGFAFLLLLLLLASDALLWLVGGTAAQAAPAAAGMGSAAAARAALVAGIALVAGSLALRSGLAPPRHQRVEVTLPRWPHALDGFRIVQLSDLHIGPLLDRRFARHVVDRANALDADLVAVTGDLVDGAVGQLDGEVAPFAELRARHGVYFVTGNHDHYSGVRAWVDKARALGMRVLRNERVEIRRNGAAFDLVGVDDHRGSWIGDDGREDLARALDGRDAGRPAVLLAHDPTTFKRAQSLGVDLQLSGHTHGGQIWPFGWVVRLVVPWVAGLYRAGGAQLYVSRGTGFWGPPMRLRAPAEITELVLRSAPQPPSEEDRR